MKKIFFYITILLSISALFSACVDQNFEEPEKICTEQMQTTATIHDLMGYLTGNADTIKLPDSLVIEAYVTSTDQFGNFYKELVVQDSTAAISIMIDASYLYTKYPLGQKIYIKCGGLYLGKNGGVTKLGSTYTEYGFIKFGRIQGEPVIDAHLIKSCDNQQVTPTTITLPPDDGVLYKLVKIENVQFKQSEVNSTWADADNLETVNHLIIDSANHSLIVRTSGYANFARDSLPKGNGTIIGVLSKYNDDYQLYIRNTDDVDMNGVRFSEPILKDFEDEDIFSDGWTTQIVTGTTNWELGNHSGNNYVQCSNWDGSAHSQAEAWYISPELDLSFYSNPALSFKSAWGYSGDDIKVKYSTDYDGTSNPTSATWTDLNPTLYTGSDFWTWTNSGELDLPANTKYVAFVYYGANDDGRTWEIDDIKIDNKSSK